MNTCVVNTDGRELKIKFMYLLGEGCQAHEFPSKIQQKNGFSLIYPFTDLPEISKV